MKNLNSIRFGVAFVGVALSAACSTEPTQVTDVWKDPSYAAGPMRSVVVIGARLSDTQRRTLEDGFVSALAAHGVRATPSYTVLGGAMPDKDAARAAFQQSGFDGILVATMKGMNEATTVVGGGVGFWDGYYGPAWGSPYVVTEPIVKFETSLWDPSGTGKLVWSAITQTDNPSSGKDFTASLTGKVVPMLAKAGFIPPAPSNAVSYTHSIIQ